MPTHTHIQNARLFQTTAKIACDFHWEPVVKIAIHNYFLCLDALKCIIMFEWRKKKRKKIAFSFKTKRTHKNQSQCGIHHFTAHKQQRPFYVIFTTTEVLLFHVIFVDSVASQCNANRRNTNRIRETAIEYEKETERELACNPNRSEWVCEK